jgi:hypothetical protein
MYEIKYEGCCVVWCGALSAGLGVVLVGSRVPSSSSKGRTSSIPPPPRTKHHRSRRPLRKCLLPSASHTTTVTLPGSSPAIQAIDPTLRSTARHKTQIRMCQTGKTFHQLVLASEGMSLLSQPRWIRTTSIQPHTEHQWEHHPRGT